MASWNSLPYEVKCQILAHYVDTVVASARASKATPDTSSSFGLLGTLLASSARTSTSSSSLRHEDALEDLWHFVDAVPDMSSELLRLASRREHACEVTVVDLVHKAKKMQKRVQRNMQKMEEEGRDADDVFQALRRLKVLRDEKDEVEEELHLMLVLQLEGCHGVDPEREKRREVVVKCLKSRARALGLA